MAVTGTDCPQLGNNTVRRLQTPVAALFARLFAAKAVWTKPKILQCIKRPTEAEQADSPTLTQILKNEILPESVVRRRSCPGVRNSALL